MMRRGIFLPRAHQLAALLVASLASACGALEGGGFLGEDAPEPEPEVVTDETDFTGYVVVSNSTTRSVALLDPSLNHVRDLLVLPGTSSDVPVGLSPYDSENVMVSIEGVDRVMLLNLATGDATNLAIDSNLTGTMAGLTRLASGDILISETSNVERFTFDGLRVTSGGWPLSLQNGAHGLSSYASGGFVHCSLGSDVIRSYDDDGTQTATAVSGIGGTTDVHECEVGPDGQVVAVFNGTTDTVRVYSDSTLATATYSYSDLALLANPFSASFRENGNVLAVDFTTNLVVEIDTTGNLVTTYASTAISGANKILVIR